MIIKFNNFINESNDLELHYYAFDWDDNILHMPTCIHMDKKENGSWIPIDVSTSDFAIVRNDWENYRLVNQNPDQAFSEFRDTGHRGESAFIEDVKVALSKNDYGPSWEVFLKCLTEGALFAIITARGHEPQTMRKAVDYIIDTVLSEEDKFLLYSNCLKHAHMFSFGQEYDRIPKTQLSKTPLVKDYLNNCDFYGISSPSFKDNFNLGDALNPEIAKEKALDKFIEKCNILGKKVGAKSISVGFSDDDSKNVEHVNSYFKEKSALSNNLMPHKVKLNLYKTTDRSIKGGERTKFHESNASSQAPGMASSIMPFSQFNNMNDRMFTNNLENDKSNRLGSNQLLKMSKDYLKIKKKRKNKIQENLNTSDLSIKLESLKNLIEEILSNDNEYLNDILTDGNDWILENILLSESKIEEINNFISSYKSTMSSENPFLGKEF